MATPRRRTPSLPPDPSAEEWASAKTLMPVSAPPALPDPSTAEGLPNPPDEPTDIMEGSPGDPINLNPYAELDELTNRQLLFVLFAELQAVKDALRQVGEMQQWVNDQAAVAQQQLNGLISSGGGFGGMLKMAKSILGGKPGQNINMIGETDGR